MDCSILLDADGWRKHMGLLGCVSFFCTGKGSGRIREKKEGGLAKVIFVVYNSLEVDILSCLKAEDSPPHREVFSVSP